MDNQDNSRFPEDEKRVNETPQQDDASRTNDTPQRKKTSTAANIDAIISSATDNVRARRHRTNWSNTGTNISYEGPTAPGGGGSVGTGQASGQNAVGARISTDSDYGKAHIEHPHKGQEENKDNGTFPEDDRSEEKDII